MSKIEDGEELKSNAAEVDAEKTAATTRQEIEIKIKQDDVVAPAEEEAAFSDQRLAAAIRDSAESREQLVAALRDAYDRTAAVLELFNRAFPQANAAAADPPAPTKHDPK